MRFNRMCLGVFTALAPLVTSAPADVTAAPLADDSPVSAWELVEQPRVAEPIAVAELSTTGIADAALAVSDLGPVAQAGRAGEPPRPRGGPRHRGGRGAPESRPEGEWQVVFSKAGGEVQVTVNAKGASWTAKANELDKLPQEIRGELLRFIGRDVMTMVRQAVAGRFPQRGAHAGRGHDGERGGQHARHGEDGERRPRDGDARRRGPHRHRHHAMMHQRMHQGMRHGEGMGHHRGHGARASMSREGEGRVCPHCGRMMGPMSHGRWGEATEPHAWGGPGRGAPPRDESAHRPGHGPGGFGPRGFGPRGFGPRGFGQGGFGPGGFGPGGFGEFGGGRFGAPPTREARFPGGFGGAGRGRPEPEGEHGHRPPGQATEELRDQVRQLAEQQKRIARALRELSEAVERLQQR